MTSHPVLPGSDGENFASLSRAATPRSERYRIGRGLRKTAPRTSLDRWSHALRRVDPIDLVVATNAGRVESLVPERIRRMSASPHAFLRGAAAVHAADFAVLPSIGIHPVICGDAHLGNFGFYASPERELVFDLNDFDEAHPGAWEWDLRRLVASTWVAGRDNDASEDRCEEAVARCVHAYRRHIARLAEAPLLERSFERLDADRLHEGTRHKRSRTVVANAAKRARTRTSDRALPRFVTSEGGARRIVVEPPLITRPDGEHRERILAALDDYLDTLPSHWARILGGYRAVDVAHKVVGVGSVGLRAYLALCEGSSPDDVLFLQLKQARRSVVAPFVHGDEAWHAHQGQRVVEYQQALQTVSDPLLGWTTIVVPLRPALRRPDRARPRRAAARDPHRTAVGCTTSGRARGRHRIGSPTVTVVETLLTFVVAPGVLYGAIALWTSAGYRRRRARYKVGDAWPYEPLFWIANPEGAHPPAHGDAPAIGSGVTTTQDTRGGTGGKW